MEVKQGEGKEEWTSREGEGSEKEKIEGVKESEVWRTDSEEEGTERGDGWRDESREEVNEEERQWQWVRK